MAQDIPDRGPTLVHCMIALILLADVSVILRFVSRKIARCGYWYDDYMVVLAMLLANGNAICVFVAVHYDFGKHVKDAQPDAVAKWHEILYIYQNIYAPAIATTKLSVLLFYSRIFPLRKFRLQVYTLTVLVVLWWVASQLTVIVECIPIDWAWTQKGDGHCINLVNLFIGQAIPNIITDGIMLCVAIPPIWSLQLPRSQKVAISGILMLGGFVIFASIYRLVLLFSVPLMGSDITWSYSQVVLWSGVEPNVGVVCANLPCLRPLLRPFTRVLSAVNSTTNASRMRRAKGKNANDGGEFIRLRHIGVPSENNAATSIRDDAYGLRAEIGGMDWEDEAGMVPMGRVHVRKGVDLRDV